MMAGEIGSGSPSSGVDPPPAREIAARTPCRPFNVGDAMIAVAAVAAALALVRMIVGYYVRTWNIIPFGELSGFRDWWMYLTRHPWVVGGVAACGFSALMVLLLAASLAFLAMRMRQPSPPLEELVRQPGMAAVEAMWAGVFAGVVLDSYGLPAAFGILAIGLPVPAAWAALAWTGRWRPEPGWIDPIGRRIGVWWCILVGFYGIAMTIAGLFPPPRL
jgi:hypothetical protein